MITASELREKYFAFFKEKGHSIIPSAPLVPENDPTVLFTTAGMHPLVPYLLGEKHPAGKRLTNVQKCVRTGDIDEVGDATHLTFFEMLGNWSLGDYFKKESISWSWEFLTDVKWLGIDPGKLFITVYEGDLEVPKDDESIKIWQGEFQSVGIDASVGERIFLLGRYDNWWGPAGKIGPCGPDTEIFFDTGKEACGQNCQPGCNCGKYVEIWNNVFMEYNKRSDGSYVPLAQKNVDTGMGVERTVAVLNGQDSVFEMDTFAPIIEKIRSLKPSESPPDPLLSKGGGSTVSERIIADHVRAAAVMISDGVTPSNIEHGYVLRRLIRRAIRHSRLLGIKGAFLGDLAQEVFRVYDGVYESIRTNHDRIVSALGTEEDKFAKTLSKGLAKFSDLVASEKAQDRTINAKDAFDLFQSYGFPLEITQELAREHNLGVDEKGFYEEFNKHQELSRTASSGKFKGGLADHGETAVKYHTATHLLHAGLHHILGEHAVQKGSNITAERLRFDFVHPQKMTAEEIKKVEGWVNDAIKKDYPVSCEEMSVKEAKAQGAMGLFEGKYAGKVKVYSIGDVSKEICGGPHVEHTGVLGTFRITKEESASSGVRRIRAVLE
ncbi:MAG: alanine--tRNA ligase [Parcubacteria group bacterium]|nr:alanine--tRNA ligase [Parcubacteria group bacterium]